MASYRESRQRRSAPVTIRRDTNGSGSAARHSVLASSAPVLIEAGRSEGKVAGSAIRPLHIFC